MKKFLAAVMCLVVLALAGCSGQAASGGAAPTGGAGADTIKVGLITPLTGPVSWLGESYRNGTQLAIDEVNNAGGIMNRKLQLFVEDSGGTADTAVTAFKRMKEKGLHFLLGTPLSPMGMALAPEVKAAKIPTILYGSHPDMLKGGRPWTFRINPTSITEASVPVHFLVEDLKAKRIGMLYQNDDAGKKWYEVAKDTLKQLGLEMVAAEANGTNDNDVSAQLLKLKQANVDAIILGQAGSATSVAVKQLNDLGMNVPVVGMGPLANAQILKVFTPDQVKNIHAVLNSTVFDDKNDKAVAFQKAYKAKYNKMADQNAASYYDAIYLLKQAVENAKTTDPEALRDAVGKLSGIKGASNVYTFDANGEASDKAAIVKINDKLEPVQLVAKDVVK